MAERELAVSLIIGGAMAPTLTRAFKKTELTGIRTGKSIADAMTKAQLGERLSRDVIRYGSKLDALRSKQTTLGRSSARLAARIDQVQALYRKARHEAKAYGISIADVAAEHRQFADAARVAERRVGRLQAAQQNRQIRSQVKGDIFDAAAPALLLAKPITEAIEFESTMADVKKVIDDIKPAGLKQLSDQILRLSTDDRIPMTANSIGDIVAAAAQAKVPKGELIQFARDAAKVGTAFDITGRQAGKAMAGIRNIFKVNQKGAVLVADSINYLGNKMDAEAPAILNVVERAGSLGDMVGFTGQQVSALAASLIELKTGPEEAATAINFMLTRLSAAHKQPKAFQRALREIGTSGQEMRDAIKDDAQGTLLSFFQTLKDSDDAVGILSDLFGAERAPKLVKLVNGFETYKHAVDLASDSAVYGGAVNREYAERAATTANDLKILANQAIRLAIATGRTLLPSVKAVARELGKLADIGAALAERYPTVTKVIGVTAISLVGLKIATLGARFAGTLFSDAWRLAGGILDRVAPKLVTQTKGMLALQAASLKGAGGLNLLSMKAIPALGTAFKSLAAGSLFTPIGLGIAAIAGGALLIMKFWKPIKAFMGGIWLGLQEVLGPFGPTIQAVVDMLKTAADWWMKLLSPVNASAEALSGAAAAGKAVGHAIGSIIEAIGSLFSPISKASEVMANMFGSGESLVTTFGAEFKAAGSTVLDGIKSWFGQVADLLPHSDAKVGPLSTLTASGRALVTTLGQGIAQAGPGAIAGPLSQALAVPIGPLPLSTLAMAGVAPPVPRPPARPAADMLARLNAPRSGSSDSASRIHIDMRGMTIHANTAADAQAIGDALEVRMRKVVEELDRRRQAKRRASLHDGDGPQLGSL